MLKIFTENITLALPGPKIFWFFWIIAKDYKLSKFSESFPRSSAIKSLDFERTEEKKEKPILAYTTDIEVFRTCSLKYRFIRKLDFKAPSTRALSFGTNTHKLAEYYSLMPNDRKNLMKFLEKILNTKTLLKISSKETLK